MKDLKELSDKYHAKKDDIKKRLNDFQKVLDLPDEKIFSELAFCIFTPQSKAKLCWSAVETLQTKGLLLNGSQEELLKFLTGIRFPFNKAKYLVEARNYFSYNGEMKIKEKILDKDVKELRKFLVENVKGFGMKEASHFMRNVGLGKDLAILDRHILKNMKEFGIIDEIPKTLTQKKYLETESKLKEFSEKIQIPMDELDLLFWSEETGEIFK